MNGWVQIPATGVSSRASTATPSPPPSVAFINEESGDDEADKQYVRQLAPRSVEFDDTQ